MRDIVVCDDEPIVCETIAEFLQEHEFEVRQVGNGQECLAVLRDRPADVVILDLHMPIRNGIETLIDIRKEYSPAMTSIIMLTGHTDKKLIVEAAKHKITTYLVKPPNMPDLCKLVEKSLPFRVCFADLDFILGQCHMADTSLLSEPGLTHYKKNTIKSYKTKYNEQDVCVILPSNTTPQGAASWDEEQAHGELTLAIKLKNTWYKLWPDAPLGELAKPEIKAVDTEKEDDRNSKDDNLIEFIEESEDE